MAVFLDNHSETCYSVLITGDDGFGSPELREEMPAGRPVTGSKSVESSKFRWNHGLKLSSP